MREFESGATRDDDATKADYEGFLSPAVLERYGQYMLKHQKQADGQRRDSDNWQKGIPPNVYMKSLLRHVFDVWLYFRGRPVDLEEALCAVMFNAMGILFETLEKRWGEAEVKKEPQKICRYCGGLT